MGACKVSLLTGLDVGVSPFITLGEFLGCPSRVARFCEAFWVLAQRAHCSLTYVKTRYASCGLLAFQFC